MSDTKADRKAVLLLRMAMESCDANQDRLISRDILDWYDGEDEFTHDESIRAALRTIDRLTAERDAARTELQRLRAVLGGVPGVLESYAESVQPHLDSSPNPAAGLALSIIRAKAATIRAALESEADHD